MHIESTIKYNTIMHKLTDIDDFLSKLKETDSFKAYKEQEVWDYFQKKSD